MGKIAFVFSGQGAQNTGMGRGLYEKSPAAREVFDLADSLRPGTSRQCFEGSAEELKQTINTQPCVYCVDLAAAEALREAGINASMLAGFSLGEVAALTFSGAVSRADGFKLVCRRAELMQAEAERWDSMMVAVLKLDNAAAESLCERYERVYPVNYNCPGQLVVAGLSSEMESFKADVKAAGGRAMLLAVSAGFHSPFMSFAARAMESELECIQMAAPGLPLYSNYTAAPYGGADMEALPARQIESPVRWQETIQNMIRAGADTFIEVGPGKTLSGLIAKISGEVSVYNVEDEESLLRTVEAVKSYA